MDTSVLRNAKKGFTDGLPETKKDHEIKNFLDEMAKHMETVQVVKPQVSTENNVTPLGVAIENALGSYFSSLGDQAISNLYKIVRDEVEEALLRFVMKFVRNNQSKAAHLLGVSRTTLRKKLKEFDLL